MNRTCARLLLLAAAASSNGCAMLHSDRFNPDGATPDGIAYMLPKALLPVELVDRGEALALEIQQPVIVGDSRHLYVMRRSSNSFSSDDVTVEVDPATGLLHSVKAKGEDTTLDVLKKVAGAVFKPEFADAGAQATLYRVLIEPGVTDLVAVNESINKLALEHLKRKVDACTDAKAAACVAAGQMHSAVVASPFKVDIVLPAGALEATRKACTRTRCSARAGWPGRTRW